MKDGYIKRVYNSGNINCWYIFNPLLETPNFYVNNNKLPKIYSKDDKGNDDLNKRVYVIRKVQNYNDMTRKVWALQNKYPNQDIPDFKIPAFKGITLDTETYLDNNDFKLLSICFYDGVNQFKFYRVLQIF